MHFLYPYTQEFFVESEYLVNSATIYIKTLSIHHDITSFVYLPKLISIYICVKMRMI